MTSAPHAHGCDQRLGPRVNNTRVIVAGLLSWAVVFSSGCGDGPGPVDYDARPVWLWDASPLDAPWPIDATPPDACPLTVCNYACVDTTRDPQYCGDCETTCSPAAGCVESDCACPEGFIPAALVDGDPAPTFNTEDLPVVSLRATFLGNDTLPHQLRLSWDSTTVAVDTVYDLAAVTTPTVRLSYNRSFVGPRGTFVPTAGTLELDRMCSDGVAGTLSDLTLIEVAFSPSGSTPIPGGCSLEVAAITFDFGTDCPE